MIKVILFVWGVIVLDVMLTGCADPEDNDVLVDLGASIVGLLH